jgi:hypothetical protein
MRIDENLLLYARLKNQFLIDRASCSTVLSSLCGLQAQFANNPKYALRIRGRDFNEATWSEGLVKIWSFRHTLHAIALEELGLFLSSAGIPEKWEDAWNVDGHRLEFLANFMFGRISAGVENREDLKKKCREAGLRQDELDNIFNGWGGVFYEMSRRGMIAYRPGTAKKFLPCPPVAFMDTDSARAILLRRYFKTFGPASLEDCAAFTGYKKREIVNIMAQQGISPHSAHCGGVEYFYLGRLPRACAIPDCVFLTGFDQMIMGYKNRAFIMDEEHKRRVITVSGIVNPTVLLNGRICAKWKKEPSRLVVTPFRKLSKKDRENIASYGELLFSRDISAGGVEDIVFE